MNAIIRLARLVKRIVGKILKPFTGLMHSLFGRQFCSVCNRNVIGFCPLPRSYVESQERYGYKRGSAETCNREHYSCPHCDSADRERLYAIYLLRIVRKEANAETAFSLLDLAPNRSLSSFITSEIAELPNFHYRTADLDMEGVDDKVDITDMSIYEDGHFDFFICSHILEHVKDDRRALQELYRILKPGGRGILMVPIDLSCKEIDEDPNCNDVAERWRRFGQGDHVRKYSKQGFIDRVGEACFHLEQRGVQEFGVQEFIKHGIDKKSVLYIVTKPLSPQK